MGALLKNARTTTVQTRTTKIEIRLTPQEKTRIEQLAQRAEISVSDLLRFAVWKLPLPVPEINHKTYLELGKAGNTLLELKKVIESQQPFSSSKVFRILLKLNKELSFLMLMLTQIQQELLDSDRQTS